MLGALAIIWIGFHFWSGGTFLTPRNLWNLSVQTATVAIMATGMVLIIVSRNIDLSVGVGAGRGRAWRWPCCSRDPPQVARLRPLGDVDHRPGGRPPLGALIGAFHGFIVAYVGVPSFIVTLGGLLVWRGVAWAMASGRTIAPMDTHFRQFGGGSTGTIGGFWSWIVGGRRLRGHRGAGATAAPAPQVRPAAPPAVGRDRPRRPSPAAWCSSAFAYLNRYYLPSSSRRRRGGGNIPFGLANPVLIVIGVTLVMTFIATRLRFGRYVFAIGGNPEAAELGGIKTSARSSRPSP